MTVSGPKAKKKRVRATVTMRAPGAPWGETRQQLHVELPHVVFIDIVGPKGLRTLKIHVDRSGMATISGGG
jgi:hypothetical protein